MQLVRTTLRLDRDLKKSAEMHALENDQTFQEVINQALAQYLIKEAKADAKKIVFHTHDFGTPIENLTRDDIYNSIQEYPDIIGDELNADMSSSFGGKPRSLERGGCHDVPKL